MQVRLRAAGCMRVGVGAFLLLWLVGWGAGGYALIAPMVPTLGLPPLFDDAPARPGPLLILAPIWIAGLAAAGFTLLRLLFGVDTLAVEAGELVVRKGVGPFHRTRRISRTNLRAIGQGPRDSSLVAWLAGGNEMVLSSLGTPRERQRAAEHLRTRLVVDAPSARVADLDSEWSVTTLASGVRIEPSIRSRRGCLGCGAVVLVILFVVAGFQIWSGETIGAIIVTTVAAIVAILTLLTARARESTEASKGLIRRSERLGPWSRTSSIEPMELEVKISRDSDGDQIAHLVARSSGGTELTLYRSINDPWKLVALGERLSQSTGARLVIPAELRQG